MRTSAGERSAYKQNCLPSKMMNNNVLLRVDEKEGDGRSISDKVDIVVAGAEWNEATHVIRYGTVVSVPDSLVNRNMFDEDQNNPKCINSFMEWGTEIEIEVGDVVYMGIMASANVHQVVIDDVLYYIVPYSSFICRLRGDDVYPLNGYVLMDGVMKETEIKNLVIYFKDEQDKKRGVIKHNGRDNDWYLGSRSVDADVEIGDEVLFSGNFFGVLEDDLFAKLPKGMGFAQKCWIIAKTN